MSLKPHHIFRTPSRYLVEGEVPGDFADTYEQALALNAFKAPISQDQREPRTGWTNPAFPLEPVFTNHDHWLYNQYIVLSMRIDQKKLPPRLFRETLNQRVKEWCATNNRDRCPATVRGELKESLENEMLKRVLPSMKTFEAAWNLDEGWVAFSSSSTTTNDIFRKLFHRTFGLKLTPHDPADWLDASLRERAGCGRAGSDDATGILAPYPSEFLAWLLWREREGRGEMDVEYAGNGGKVSWYVDGRATLEHVTGSKLNLHVDSDTETALLSTLAGGGVITALPLVVKVDDREYKFKLSDHPLTRMGVKLPGLVKGGDEAEQLAEACFLYEELEYLVGALFSRFMELRLSEGWETQGTAAQNRWMAVSIEEKVQGFLERLRGAREPG